MSIDHNTLTLIERMEARIGKFRASDVSGVEVGSFGINYAAIHEFGFNGIVQIRQHQRKISKAFGKQLKGGPKLINVSAHSSRRNIRARPYLRPAVTNRSTMVMDIIREALLDRSENLTPAFTRIGNILKTEIVRNIRSQRLIDQGGLINSIRYEFLKRGQ